MPPVMYESFHYCTTGLGRDVAKALWSAGATTIALSKTKENIDGLVAEVGLMWKQSSGF